MDLTATEVEASMELIVRALVEDLGPDGDRTTLALIPETQTAIAAFVARAPGVIAGLSVARRTIETLDSKLKNQWNVMDGDSVQGKMQLGTLSGSLRSILFVERTALNFLQRLSGIATLTRKFVDAVAGTKAKVLDTRKTTPGWRALEKYAVRCGGGVNHRVGLFDAILIKDNHIAGVGGDVVEAVKRARAYPGNAGLPVEIEVDSLEQLEKVLAIRPEIVMLDNMTLPDMSQAVSIRDRLSRTTQLEASGGVTLQTVRTIAETGVDRISVGAITHSAPALDIALDIPT